MKTLQEAYQQFDIEQLIQTQLAGTPTALNAYEECCGRYTGTQQTALIWEGKHGQTASWTFDQLAEASGKLANYFTQLGLKAGDCIAGLLPRTPELLITVFATWRIGAVYQPLFTAFESKAIEHRIQTAKTQLIVTNTEQRPKLNALSNVKILTVDAANQAQNHDTDFWQVLSTQDTYFETVYRSFEDDFLMMFTSGTTGLAKSVPVPLKAIVAFKGYMQHAVDLRAEDSFWNLADPGWAYGLYYGITGPLSLGHSKVSGV